jgi:hypothetical protein
VVWLVLLFCLQAKAQQPYSFPLPNQLTDVVYNIHQDSKGFVWLATNKGLMRYDGYEYQLYRSDKQTSVAGSNIQEDKYGRIWYQNFDGFLYYVENDTLNNIVQNDPAGFISYGITDQYLFIVQKKGVDIFDLQSLKLIKTLNITFEEAESATTLHNNFYLIADDIVYKINESRIVSKSSYFENQDQQIKYILPFKGQLCIVSKFNEKQKMYFLDANLNFVKSFNIPEVSYIQASNVIHNEIWLHTPKGAFAYTENGTLVYENGLFSESSSSKVIKDHQNNYWFSSVNQGIFIVPELKHEVFSIHQSHLLRFCKTPNGYLFATQKGELISTDSQFENKKKLRSLSENIPTYYVYHDPIDATTILSDKGFSIITDNNFSATKTYNIALKEIVRLDDKYYGFAASNLSGLLLNPKAKSQQSSVWDALFHKNADINWINLSRVIKGNRAKSLDYSLKNNRLVIATNVGLYLITPHQIKEIKHNNQSVYVEKVLTLNDIFYVLDTKGNLYKIKEDYSFEKMNGNERIPDDYIRMIKKSNNELLIVGMEYIYVYDIHINRIEKIDFLIQANQIHDIIKESNELLILTKENVIKIPLNFEKNTRNALFRINAFLVNQQKRDSKKKLQLGYDENMIEIQFSVLDYREKTTPAYYRINHKDWILIHKETRSIQFPSLSSGDYLIEFKVGDVICVEQIAFKISPPFWNTWWFYMLAMCLGSVLVFLYFNWKSKIMRNQIKLLNEKVILEKNLSKSMLASIKAQMNPHFFYNALNTIQAYIFTNDKQKANTYLAKFSKLTRTILEMSEKETISLSEEIESLQLYLELEKMRFTDNFHYEIVVKNIPDKECIEFPPMLIQPYVENAIKHGLLHQRGDKKITIGFTQIRDNLKVIITDNGIGRKRSTELNKIKNEKHQSFSTQANEKRLEILNKGKNRKVALKIIDNFNEFGIPTGTTVELTIPIQ